MVDWRTLEAKVDKTIGATFGEEVRHHPMTKGVADTGRPVQAFRGVLHTPSPEGTINIGRGIVTTMAAAEAGLVVERALVAGMVFRKGDRIAGMSRPGEPTWEIRNTNDRYTSVIVLVLNQV